MTSPTGVNIADLDGNGVLDFAVTTGPGEISVVYRNGPYSSGPPVKYNVGSPHRDCVLANVNGDALPDIAASMPYKNTVSVLLNKGNGIFGAPANYLAGWSPGLMTSGDWNGDGRDDLAYNTFYTVGVMMSTCSP